jgi:hypothetical protein
MIIIKVQGGLGNQLLQYSVGRVLSESFGKEVKYDLSFFEEETKYTKRPYLLDRFETSVPVATKEEIAKVRYPYFFSTWTSLFVRACNKYIFKRYYIGYEPSFFPRIKRNNALYLEGFWQSYKYYESLIPLLSKEVTLKDASALSAFKQEVAFTSKVTVAIHVRRGDLVTSNGGMQIIPKEYYERAVPLFEEKVAAPTYCVFSDDIEWVKKEMGHLFKDVIYVSSYSLKDYEEFALIKECNHAILSNSTFCWFATLLTDTDAKVVMYPKDWRNAFLNNSPPICPDRWVGV